MPDFQIQAVKGPLCPLQSFTGTADSRPETAFQACLYQSNLLLCSGGTPGETSAPWLCWREGGLDVCTPRQPHPRLPNFPFTQLSSSTSLLLLAGLLILEKGLMYRKTRYLSGGEIKPLSILLHSFYFIGRLFLSCLLWKRHYNIIVNHWKTL